MSTWNAGTHQRMCSTKWRRDQAPASTRTPEVESRGSRPEFEYAHDACKSGMSATLHGTDHTVAELTTKTQHLAPHPVIPTLE